MAATNEPAARADGRKARPGRTAGVRTGGATKATLMRRLPGKTPVAEHVNVTIPADLVARARSLAGAAGQPLSRVFSDALDQYLHVRGLADLLDELNAEYGPLPPDPVADARWDAVLDDDQARQFGPR